MALKFYIKERENPQFKKPYYVACGQLTQKAAKRQENAVYGHNRMIPHDTKEEYDAAINSLKMQGFTVMTS